MVGRSVAVMDRAVSTTFYNLLLTWAFELPNLAVMKPVKDAAKYRSTTDFPAPLDPEPFLDYPFCQTKRGHGLEGSSMVLERSISATGGLRYRPTKLTVEVGNWNGSAGSGHRGQIHPSDWHRCPDEVRISRLTRPGYHIFGGSSGNISRALVSLSGPPVAAESVVDLYIVFVCVCALLDVSV